MFSDGQTVVMYEDKWGWRRRPIPSVTLHYQHPDQLTSTTSARRKTKIIDNANNLSHLFQLHLRLELHQTLQDIDLQTVQYVGSRISIPYNE